MLAQCGINDMWNWGATSWRSQGHGQFSQLSEAGQASSPTPLLNIHMINHSVGEPLLPIGDLILPHPIAATYAVRRRLGHVLRQYLPSLDDALRSYFLSQSPAFRRNAEP